MISTLTDYLEETAQRLPDKIAYVCGEQRVTFQETRACSRKVGQALEEAGVYHAPVLLYMEKSIEAVEAILGVAYSGNFYTVLDTEMPKDRVEKILNTLEPSVVVTSRALQERARKLAPRMLLMEDILSAPLTERWERQAHPCKVMSNDPLYVLFTSGSTGVPKGVVASHAAMLGYINAWPDVYRIDEQERLLSQVPFHFVMSSIDIFSPIAYGATAHLVPSRYYSIPIELAKYIERERITALNWVPSALMMVAAVNAFEAADFSSIRKVLFGGEVIPMKILRRWRKALPQAFFVNGYGATETTDACLFYQLDREFEDGEQLPIGRPYPHMEVLLLDENDQLVTEPGKKGEICARSISLALGYYKDPVHTAQVFVKNPACPAYEEKIYRTGDLGYLNEEGLMMYGGRADFQIKHLGHRIELGEIEAAALQVEGVGEAACIYDKQRQHILLFYTGTIDQAELGETLKNKLLPYMLPWKRYFLTAMPKNDHGKVDRMALKRQIGIE